ncbi:kinase-like protein [Meira miltonrushii]|uniref:Kinase-like protein n=1 Tax=Meira miltonrushii TaxID=1280837 RepID=A0A316V3Q1_9BASI|nr:kinase-like protein [Meira miltonrushii]PWN32187.1 kinase-like protein [Meira miltonrushii]
MHANGVPAARGWRLDARKAKTPAFQAQVLALFSEQLQIDTWSEQTVNPDLWPLDASRVQLKRISGAFSNAVFFVSYDKQDCEGLYPKTVLLRVYGKGTEVLLSRRAELLILHTLSSLYEIGPHILGTFANGRVETYFDAEPIGKDGIRDLGDRRETIKEDGSLLVRGSEGRAQWVARRMRQLHEVPLETMRTVLEQGDLRANGDGSSVYGRGIENHLFARSHRPRMHRNPSSIPPSQQNILDSSRNLRDTMSIRGFSPHRNNSVTSFDSLATSFNSQDSSSINNENGFSSPSFGPTGSGPSSYTESVNAPYPGMWRRSKRWAREAGKVLALVDEFCKTDAGQAACKRALKGTPLEGREFSPFTSFNDINVPSLELGTTVNSLRITLLAIASLNFPRFLAEMDAFKAFIRKWEKLNGASRRVLAHGDTQYSNLLLIKEGAFEEDSAGKGMPRERSRDSSKPTDSPEISKSRSSSISSNKRRSRSRRAPYERLIVIDFEYCSPNPRAYDIANAFHEWRFDYHHITDCWSPYTFAYPTRDERRRWLRAYVEQGRLLRMRGKAPKAASDPTTAATAAAGEPNDQSLPPALPNGEELELPPCVMSKERSNGNGSDSPRLNAVRQSPLAFLERSMQKEIDRLEKEVEIFSPACHAAWALWGMTFAKESIEQLLRNCLQGNYVDPALVSARDMENGSEVIAGSAESFDNLRYTLSRVELFRAELKALGVQVSPT